MSKFDMEIKSHRNLPPVEHVTSSGSVHVLRRVPEVHVPLPLFREVPGTRVLARSLRVRHFSRLLLLPYGIKMHWKQRSG